MNHNDSLTEEQRQAVHEIFMVGFEKRWQEHLEKVAKEKIAANTQEQHDNTATTATDDDGGNPLQAA